MKNSSPIEMTSKPTSVSLFIPNLDGGGAERVMLHLAEGFAKRGLKADLVVAKAEGAYLKKVPPEVRLIDLKAKSPVILSKTLALKRYLQHERPTFLLSTLDILSSATWAKHLAGVPTGVVMCVQTNLSQQFRDRHGVLMTKLKSYLVKQFYPWADAIVAASKGVAEDLAHMADLPLTDIEVIYNPVVTSNFFDKVKEPIAHPWFAPGQPPVILGVGRLVKQKDFLTLVRAFALVRQRHPAQPRLMILGDVDEREPLIKPQLEALVQELGLEGEVALPGFVENPYAYMAKAAVFVLSSIYEGFGNVVAEALAAGTPVVSTDCESGPAEILEYGKYGKLVPVGDFNALADAIANTLSNPTDPEILRQRSQVFSVDRVVDQYLEVLNSLTKQG
ncbi:MAG: glycosyltransferase [Coleofasciculus sp. S288]|nr:glycosyltransferase [Coleofasciculus sp. S288]